MVLFFTVLADELVITIPFTWFVELLEFSRLNMVLFCTSCGAADPVEMVKPQTEAAVKDFQLQYADEILTPAELTEPNGFWGQLSRSVADRLCEK